MTKDVIRQSAGSLYMATGKDIKVLTVSGR